MIPQTHFAHPNVTPLIDVVMCLIIFFMLVAKIGVTTGAESINIPASERGIDLKDLGNTLTLNVREVGDQPFITALVDGSSREPRELKLVDPLNPTRHPLRDVLTRLRYGNDMKPGGAGASADNDKFKVIIRGDRDMSYRALEPILETCMEANVDKVDFNTAKTK